MENSAALREHEETLARIHRMSNVHNADESEVSNNTDDSGRLPNSASSSIRDSSTTRGPKNYVLDIEMRKDPPKIGSKERK